jgi:aldehyde dehydrogenase (NAD+)
MDRALAQARAQGGTMHGGDRVRDGVPAGGVYVQPAPLEIPANAAIVRGETFAPILYILGYNTLEEAIAIHNAVAQGLSSAIFTLDIREAEFFLSPSGSDCGIANVNIGTSRLTAVNSGLFSTAQITAPVGDPNESTWTAKKSVASDLLG